VTVAILVPVLGRPHRVAPLMQAFRRTTPHPYRLLFIADPDDQPELDAIRRARADYIVRAGSYARKINEAVRTTSEPLLFLAADDLAPQPDWLESATRRLRGPVRVVGVNDLITRRRREHATHFLMTRDYATQPTLDGSRGPLAEAYRHSFVDDELIATAITRGAYAYAPDSHVRHEHPMVDPDLDDDTYRLGRAHYLADRLTFRTRRRLWLA
jgi:hypothetical protein